MYISQSWLQKYIPELDQLTPDTIANALSGTIAEVEKYWSVREKLENIVCGEVVDVTKMEGSNKLSICKVDIGDSIKTIICGAPNVAKNQKVAVCLIGGKVYDAHSKNPDDVTTILEKPLNGQISQGMICSAKELNLTDEHQGILILEPEMKVGTDLLPILKDTIFEIENKALNHRPDCFSHQGIARELAAILNLNYVEAKPEPILAYTDIVPIKLDVKVEEALCPRFMAAAITDVIVKPSPLWLQAKLTAIGMRAVNNVVDITNYVMFDKGQPMHAYDYDKLAGGQLTVRQAKDNEVLKALNAKDYILSKEMLVIADNDNIQDLAGIMGSNLSEVTESTHTVVLEAANFNMYNIRRTSRQLGLRSEASTRFEKGQDPNIVLIGMKTALELLLDITNSELSSELIDLYPTPKEEHIVKFNFINVKRFLGIELTKQEILSTFERLKLKLADGEKIQNVNPAGEINEEVEITIPTYRSDLNTEYDLLEEIARMYGYEKIIPTIPIQDLTPPKSNEISKLMRKCNEHLVKLGLNEIQSYTFIDPQNYQKLGLETSPMLELQNPLSPELSFLRRTLVPSLLNVIVNNAKKYNEINLFEINRVILNQISEEQIPDQPRKISVMLYDANSQNQYSIIKGILDSLLSELYLEVEYVKLNKSNEYLAPILHKNRAAHINLNTKQLGIIAEINLETLNTLGLKGRVAFFEIDFNLIQSNYKPDKQYKKLSIYPEVYRDLSFWLESNTQYQDIQKAILEIKLTNLKSINFKDTFQDKDNNNRQSMTIAICLQSSEKTLTDEEINSEINKITSKLTSSLKLTLRDGK